MRVRSTAAATVELQRIGLFAAEETRQRKSSTWMTTLTTLLGTFGGGRQMPQVVVTAGVASGMSGAKSLIVPPGRPDGVRVGH